MKEIALPLHAELATRKLIGREGGSPELPEKLVLGDQLTNTLRLYERVRGELKERIPVVKSLRATLGKTMEPPTSGAFKLQLDESTPATVTVNIAADGVLFAAQIQITPTDGGPVFIATAEGAFTGAFATMEESLQALRDDDPDEEFFSISEIEDGEFTVTVRAAGAHQLQFDCVDLDTANKSFEADGFNGAVTADIAFNATAGAVQTALNDARVASVEKPTESCWVVKTTIDDDDDGWAPFLREGSNALVPHSFVRVRPYTLAGKHWFEIRLIQTPLAATQTHERVLPDPPSIERIQAGGSGSSTDDVKINEIQALTLPDDFQGTYVLGWDTRKTDLLGIDDGPEQIAAALNAMWNDGQTRFEVTNPESGKAYIEFVGPLGDASQVLITATVKSNPPGVLTFTLNLRTAELDAALRAVPEITVPLEVELYVLPDGEDPETSDKQPKAITVFQQSFKVVREQSYDELGIIQSIDWLKPPQPRSYVPFSPDQVITGQQHYVVAIGDEEATTFVIAHNLDTDAISSILIRENSSDGRELQNGADYQIGFTNDNSLLVEMLGTYAATPAGNGALLVVVTAAGPKSAFQDHTHTIGQITGLQDELDELKARLAAIEDHLPTVSPTTPANPTGSVYEIPIPQIAEVFPGRFGPDFNPVSAAKDVRLLPRAPGLLPALHVASEDVVTFDEVPDPMPVPSATEGDVWFNDSGSDLLLPGGLGRRSATVPSSDPEDSYFASDGRVLYRVNKEGTTTSFFPRDFERELFVLHINDKMFRAGTSFRVTFDVELALLKATTKGQFLLVIEVGNAPKDTTPATTADNLADIEWETVRLLEQRIVLTDLPMRHSFGAQINRSAVGALSASRLQYGQWEGGAQAPDTASFVIRARLINFDTEDSAVNERGFAYFSLTNAAASIQ